jgi:hypothetical protein
MIVLLSANAFGYATKNYLQKSNGDIIRFNTNVETGVHVLLGEEKTKKIAIMDDRSFEYEFQHRDGKSKYFTFRKQGYRDVTVVVGTKLDGAFWFNTLHYSSTIASSTDSWSTKNSRQYTPNQFYIEMEKI